LARRVAIRCPSMSLGGPAPQHGRTNRSPARRSWEPLSQSVRPHKGSPV